MPLLALLACAPAASDDDAAFVLPVASLGAPLARGSGFDPSAEDAVGLALAEAVPVFGGAPGLWETPGAVWALVLDEVVRNPGVCPAEEIRDGGTVYLGDCRSSFGYEYVGEATETAWTEGGVSHARLEAELDVTADVDDPVFERISLRGAVERAVPEDGRVDAHYDVNLRLSALGALSGDDPRAAAWADWAVSGTAETRDGVWHTDLAVEIGGVGGMRLDATGLALGASCPIEADGTARLGDAVTAALSAASCDACAAVTHPDGESLACAP